MSGLSSTDRPVLEGAVVAGRRAAEVAARAAVDGLGVFDERRPPHLDEERARLRVDLRANWRQLGEDRDLLVAECAYEQWHRLLFARFLAENDLLLHPEFGAPVTLDECEELAAELGEPDGWSVAGRFAAEILPGIFRLEDPCVKLRLAPEGREALEQILAGLPAEVFRADDALGWVYQYWQKEKKDEVNRSERKIAGADLGPVTQLFTEHYMVRFLLENSLGAWWAARHPDSSLNATFEYLRFDDSGQPAAGRFESWPDKVAEVTVMDPCCGSGHFLVEAFSMLWQMRAEEEGLTPIEAQDAVLRDNLFGLELDPRCVQIAMFAVALHAWKAGSGWRQLPIPNVACSGIPVKAPIEDWVRLADGDTNMASALARLHAVSRHADTLGSLADPRRIVEGMDLGDWQPSLESVRLDELVSIVDRGSGREASDPAGDALGVAVAGLARAVRMLLRTYCLVATNPPFLGVNDFGEVLRAYIAAHHPDSRNDLAAVFLERNQRLLRQGGMLSTVMPESWRFRPRFQKLRSSVLHDRELVFLAVLGERAFASSAAAGAFVHLVGFLRRSPAEGSTYFALDLSDSEGSLNKAQALQVEPSRWVLQRAQLGHPGLRILPQELIPTPLFGQFVESRYGLRSGDAPRLIRHFWEPAPLSPRWRFHQSAPDGTGHFRGRSDVLRWDNGAGGLRALAELGIASLQGQDAWGKPGVAVKLMRQLEATLYTGESFDNNCAVLWPRNPDDLAAVWAFVSSPDFHVQVRQIDTSKSVMNRTLESVPFAIDHWRKIAAERYPNGLPEPTSDDPTQWLFEGRPEMSTAPLQVAVGRLLGYRWPEQPESDDLDRFMDADGIVCVPAVAQEPPAANRLEVLLAAAYGAQWSSARIGELLAQEGSKKKNLGDWLRDEFFKQHCTLFGNRPFVWHIWDGLREGFSALVDYHRLNRHGLEKLTYTYLGQDWVERQRAAARAGEPGADRRLAAALELQQKLQGILEGEAPFDIYVRWKELHEQPNGWDPDLNDGARVNLRPFVEAGVLRSSFNIHWRKDRGKNPDGSERHNDIHLTLAEKQAARSGATV